MLFGRFLLQVSMDLLGVQSIINGDCSCIFPYMADTVLRNAMGRKGYIQYKH